MDQLDQFRDQYNQEKFSGLVNIDDKGSLVNRKKEKDKEEKKEPKERRILKEMQGVNK
jgi:hypothetical protein